MPLSNLSVYSDITEHADATPALWNSRFQTLQRNADQLNADAGSSVDSVVGWNKGSVTTTLDMSAGTFSTLTINAHSGNTVLINAALSANTWGAQSGNTVSIPSQVLSVQTIAPRSGLTVTLLGNFSSNTVGPQSGNTVLLAGAWSTNSYQATSGTTASFGTYSVSGGTALYSSLSVTNTAQFGSSVSIGGTASVNSLGAFSGNTVQVTSHISMSNKRLTGLLPPSSNSDAANKAYVDALLSGGAPSFRGTWFTGSAGASISTRDLVYINSTGSLALADSDHSTTCPVAGVFIALGSASAPSNVTCGIVGEVGGFTSLTTGAQYFVSTTDGAVTATPPSAASDVVMAIGAAKSNVTILFRPQYIGSNAT